MTLSVTPLVTFVRIHVIVSKFSASSAPDCSLVGATPSFYDGDEVGAWSPPRAPASATTSVERCSQPETEGDEWLSVILSLELVN